MVVAPDLDRLFVSLGRSRFWFFAPVLDRFQEATAVGGMIAHATFPLHHQSHSRGGSDWPPEAKRFGAFGQQPRQLRSLLFGQFRRSAWRRLMAQCFWTWALPLVIH